MANDKSINDLIGKTLQTDHECRCWNSWKDRMGNENRGSDFLFDGRNDLLVGEVAVDEIESAHLGGRFTPAGHYETMRRLFEDFSETVEGNSLAYLPEIEAEIGVFEIYGKVGGGRIKVLDLQIYADRIYLRLNPLRL